MTKEKKLLKHKIKRNSIITTILFIVFAFITISTILFDGENNMIDKEILSGIPYKIYEIFCMIDSKLEEKIPENIKDFLNMGPEPGKSVIGFTLLVLDLIFFVGMVFNNYILIFELCPRCKDALMGTSSSVVGRNIDNIGIESTSRVYGNDSIEEKGQMRINTTVTYLNTKTCPKCGFSYSYNTKKNETIGG